VPADSVLDAVERDSDSDCDSDKTPVDDGAEPCGWNGLWLATTVLVRWLREEDPCQMVGINAPADHADRTKYIVATSRFIFFLSLSLLPCFASS